jgi:hypothetical protein
MCRDRDYDYSFNLFSARYCAHYIPGDVVGAKDTLDYPCRG